MDTNIISKVVILGTAHGSNVLGKRSPDGRLREYAYSREICTLVKAELDKRGVKCFIDLTTPQEPSLGTRVRIVNELVAKNGGAKNCVYVSIHNNAAGADGKWHTARGFCVYCARYCSEASKKLASIFHKNALALNLKGNRAYPASGYYQADFYVLRKTSCPAVLTENLFQDNESDVGFLLGEQGKAAIVKLHVDSILKYIEQ